MRFKEVIKIFKSGNTCVVGLRGRGKDMLIANVVARRKKQYVSNIDYTHNDLFLPLNFDLLDCGKNTYQNLINGEINPYSYQYPEKADIYISDAGIYFPSQYCNELNSKYKFLPTFCALSRQIGECNVHLNVQNLNRVWDKFREQSDIYINCEYCFYIGKYIKRFPFVFQIITIYDKYQSCVDRVSPFATAARIFSSGQSRTMISLEKDKHRQMYGRVSRHILFYRNRSNYDTRFFKKYLEGSDNVV